MTITAAQRTAAHAAFLARRAFVVELSAKHGATDAGGFPSAVACEAFYADLEAYDNGTAPAPVYTIDDGGLIDVGALLSAPLVTTRRMALATLCDDIAHAEGLTAANQVVLNVLVREGRAEPHHYARLAFDNAAIDIMWHQHAALLGNSLEDRA